MTDPNEQIRTVELTKYNPEWTNLFIEEADKIKSILGENYLEIHHIGSTAIPHIYAKPIIDILPVVKDITLVDSLNSKFEALGYICMGEYGIPGRRYYWKSKTKRTHQIHLFEQGSSEILRHITFKEFMIAHEEYAQGYSVVKQSLAEVFFTDIENYVNGKSSFIQMIDYKTGTAKQEQLDAEDNIVIQPYNSAWSKLAKAEIKTIKTIAGSLPYSSIEHFGSTAVPDLSSKPIIDIFIVLNSFDEMDRWIKLLETLGYVFWEKNPDKLHLRFIKGMPPYGMKRTHHVHIVKASNNKMEQYILFRDILRRDEKVRLEYESLKRKLSELNLTDREAYTNKKGEFIEKILREHGYLKPISR